MKNNLALTPARHTRRGVWTSDSIPKSLLLPLLISPIRERVERVKSFNPLTEIGLTIIIIYFIIQKGRTNKHKVLKELKQENLWERLSPEEIRIYLLLIIFADKVKRAGRLGSKVLQGYLGSNFPGTNKDSLILTRKGN